jgi:hypothetical protein
MRPIDADGLKIHVCDMCDDGQRECKGDESCAILCWINDMPTIEPERRHGHWIECCNELDKKCSCCDKVHGTIYENEPFCPNCGARMEDNHAE